MEFTTERLIIRPFKSTDLQDVFAIYNSDDTCKFLLHNKWTHEDMQKRFNKKLANNVLTKETILSLAVIYKTKVVGDLSVWYTNMKDTVEIGYSFFESWRGLATSRNYLMNVMYIVYRLILMHVIQLHKNCVNE